MAITMIQKKRACIFCGWIKNQISKEHVFPDWLKSIFTRAQRQTHKSQLKILRAGQARFDSSPTKLINGHSSTMKIRFVCAPCNNEWMARLEESAKQVLIPLI